MKPKYKMDKRQKELTRKKKQDQKKEEKLNRKRLGGSADDATEPVVGEAPAEDNASAVPASSDVEAPPGDDAARGAANASDVETSAAGRDAASEVDPAVRSRTDAD